MEVARTTPARTEYTTRVRARFDFFFCGALIGSPLPERHQYFLMKIYRIATLRGSFLPRARGSAN